MVCIYNGKVTYFIIFNKEMLRFELSITLQVRDFSDLVFGNWTNYTYALKLHWLNHILG